MGNIKFKPEIEFEFIKMFFKKLGIQSVDFSKYDDDRFITYNEIIDYFIAEENTKLIKTIKLNLVAGMDINICLINIIIDYSPYLTNYLETLYFYFDTDLINSYK